MSEERATPGASGVDPADENGGRSSITDEELKLLGQALTQLRSGIAYLKLYSIDSPQAQRIITGVHQVWTHLLETIGTVNFSVEKGEVVLNGERVPVAEAGKHVAGQVVELEQSLNEADLRGLTFNPELQANELGLFLQILARRQFASKDGKEINARLRQRGINHVSVNEVIYVSLNEDEKVQKGHRFGEGKGHGKIRSIAPALDHVVETIKSVPNRVSRSQVRAHAAEHLVEKDPKILGAMLAASAGGGIKGTKLAIPTGAEKWSTDPVRDAGCIRTLKRLREAIGVGATSLAAQEPLTSLMNQLLEPYQKRPECWHELINSLDSSLLDLVPEWVLEILPVPTNQETQVRLTRFLKIPPDGLLSSKEYPYLVQLLDDLLKAQDQASFRSMMQHMIMAIQLPVISVRMMAIERLLELAERYQSGIAGWHLDEYLETVLGNFAAHETNAEVCGRMLDYLVRRTTLNFQEGRASRGRTCFERLYAFCNRANQVLPESVDIAQQHIESLRESTLVDVLVQDAVQNPERQEDALAVIKALGSKTLPALIDGLRQCPDGQRVKSIIDLLAPMEGFIAALLEEFEALETPDLILRMLEGCEGIRDEKGVWLWVSGLFRHPVVEVRETALFFCGEPCDERLFPALEETVERVVEEDQIRHFLGILEFMNDLRAGPSLRSLLAREGKSVLSVDLAMSIIRMLARHRTAEIIPFLEPALESQEPGRRRVRLRAIESLGPLFVEDAAQIALGPMRDDEDEEIARTAAGVLAGLARDVEDDPPPRPTTVQRPAPEAKASPGPAQVDETPFSPPQPAPASEATATAPAPAATSKPTTTSAGGRRKRKTDVFNPFDPFASKQADPTPAPTPAPPVQEPPRPPAPPPVPLSGQLKNVSMCDLFRAAGDRVGLFVFKNRDAEGMVYLEDGMVLEAFIQGQFGLPALYEMAQMTEGTYEFLPDEKVHQRSISLPVDEVAAMFNG